MAHLLYGVTGWPLGQTLSPLIHNIGFQTLRLPGVYMAWPVPPDKLALFMDSVQLLKIQGVSVTIPHKIAIMEFLEDITERAALAGAVNTLYRREGHICGDNTDVTGFLTPLEGLPLDQWEILLLGAGGAAHAAAAGLRLAGCQRVRITSPGNSRQFPLAERMGFTAIRWEERYAQPARLIINATPLGMHGKFEGETPYEFTESTGEKGYAYDLVYNPMHTRFLKEAASAGYTTIEGWQMFMGQGNAQFKLWTGEDLPEAAKTALLAALEEK